MGNLTGQIKSLQTLVEVLTMEIEILKNELAYYKQEVEKLKRSK